METLVGWDLVQIPHSNPLFDTNNYLLYNTQDQMGISYIFTYSSYVIMSHFVDLNEWYYPCVNMTE